MHGLFIQINGNPDYAFHLGNGPGWWIKIRAWIIKRQYPNDTVRISTILKDKNGLAKIHKKQTPTGSSAFDIAARPGRNHPRRGVVR